MKKLTIITAILFTANLMFAQIINIPADYPTIQEGINAAANGDTVLVQPGTYYENINFNGKNIVVASLFITTQDTSYIAQTTIDGNMSGTVVTFNNQETADAKLCGFRIINGVSSYFGGGISCNGANPVLRNLVISNNHTSYWDAPAVYFYNNSNAILEHSSIISNEREGVACSSSDLSLIDVKILANGAVGLHLYESDIYLEDVVIANNSDGGMYCENSNPVLKSTSIFNNITQSYFECIGAGIKLYNSHPIFDSVNRCSIYNNTALTGKDLFTDSPVEVYLDTFSVLYPTAYYAGPIDNFTFDINTGIIEQIDSNIYVSPTGNNANSGLTPENALKNIDYAFSRIRTDSLHQYSVLLLNGIYSPSANGEIFPLVPFDYLTVEGASLYDVVLDAEGSEDVYSMFLCKHSQISTMTITGGLDGISCKNSCPVLENLLITENASAGIRNDINSNPSLSGVTISHNDNRGIFNSDSDITFDSILRCNIYLNKRYNNLGNDIFTNRFLNVVVDTFTVLAPTNLHATPLDSFSFDIQHGKIEQVNADLYVSPYGDNENSGLTSGEPLKNISYALSIIVSDSLNTNTIHLLEGTYSPLTNDEAPIITISDYMHLSGFSQSSVILDSIRISTKGKSLSLSGMTITNSTGIYCDESELSIENATVSNNNFIVGGGIFCENSSVNIKGATITGNTSEFGGGGIAFYYSEATLENVLVSGNTSGEGGGISCYDSDLIFKNVIISNNQATDSLYGAGRGGGVYCANSNPTFQNVLFTGNSADSDGSVLYLVGSNPILINATITENEQQYGISWNPDLSLVYGEYNSSLSIINSIIYGNDSVDESLMDLDGDLAITFSDVQNYGNIWPGEGNINENPLFEGSGDYPYQLLTGSTCIDAGTPDTTGMNLPFYDLIGNFRIWDGDGNGSEIIDMGAYEFGSVGTGIEEKVETQDDLEVQSFPNPVTKNCILEFDLPKPCSVSIQTYNSIGLLVSEAPNNILPGGRQQISVNMKDLPEGIYFVKVRIGNETATRKIIKL